MHFKCARVYIYGCGYALLFSASLLTGCGASTPVTKKSDEADLKIYSPASQSSLGFSDQVAFVDTLINELNIFSFDPLKLERSIDLKITNSKQYLFGDENGEFFISLSDDSLASLSSLGGKKNLNDTYDLEEIEAAAYSPEVNIFVVFDELGIVLIKFDEGGNPESSFRGSSSFDQNLAVVSAAIVSDGRLAVVLGETKIALVDLEASLMAEEWVLEDFELTGAAAGDRDAQSITWLAEVNESQRYLIAKDGDRVILIDIDQASVTEEQELSSQNEIWASRTGSPHLMVADSVSDSGGSAKPFTLYYADENNGLQSKLFANIKNGFDDSSLYIEDGWLVVRVPNDSTSDSDDEENESLPNAREDSSDFVGNIYRYDLAKGTLKDRTEVTSFAQVHVTSEFILENFDSVLGHLRKRDLGSSTSTDDVEELKFFNLPTLRRKH